MVAEPHRGAHHLNEGGRRTGTCIQRHRLTILCLQLGSSPHRQTKNASSIIDGIELRDRVWFSAAVVYGGR
jgi:hypothetical protein